MTGGSLPAPDPAAPRAATSAGPGPRPPVRPQRRLVPQPAHGEGRKVQGDPAIPRGTAIAKFEADGTYTNKSGSHAAIYLSQDETGIRVYNQWRGQPVHKRLIRFEGGAGSKQGRKSNDGKRFAVIG